jgi:hypothetical protein
MFVLPMNCFGPLWAVRKPEQIQGTETLFRSIRITSQSTQYENYKIAFLSGVDVDTGMGDGYQIGRGPGNRDA